MCAFLLFINQHLASALYLCFGFGGMFRCSLSCVLHLKHLVLTIISHCRAFHRIAVRTQELPFKGPEMVFSPGTR